jgi:5-(carboxyamino)imidazole ribonucleotide synthase
MVGAGQLARMTCQAAIGLGIGFRVLAANAGDSAAQVCAGTSVADYRNGPTCWRSRPAATCHLRPRARARRSPGRAGASRSGRPAGPGALRLAQDKLAMRERLTGLGIACPRFAPVASSGDITGVRGRQGWPVVLKAVSGGYDGKGVWVCESAGAGRRRAGARTARG